MKISHHKGCSCSDYLYHNELNRPSLQLLEKGSRINKSSYGKHLPRREKRLINRLVSTRTKYDDVRNKILADTNLDVNNKIMRIGRNKQCVLPDGDNINKEAIRTMVDLIDRGEMLPDGSYLKPTMKLSNCCACCYCNSKIHRLKAGNKFKTASSSRIHARRRGTDMYRKLKSVQLRTKSIQSDPCICTMNLSELCNDGFAPVKTRNQDYEETTSTNSTIASKALQAKRVICEFKLGKLSAEYRKKIKTVKDQLREGIRSSISKLETSFRIKKDSLALFREKVRLKKRLKKIECDSDFCIPEDCIPQEGFDKIKLGQRIRKFSSGLSMKAYPKIRILSKYAIKKPTPKSVEYHCKPISKSVTGGITNKKKYETMAGIVDSTVKDKFREGIRSSLAKLETSFRIKKDSLSLFREKERLKRLMKKYKCKSDFCIPEDCIPQECFEKIKLGQRIRKFSSGFSIKAYPKIRKLSKYAKKKPTPKSVEYHCQLISKSVSSMLKYTGGITNKKKYKAMDGIVDSRKTGVLIHVEPNFKKEENDRMDTKKIKKLTKETYTAHKQSSEFTHTDSGTKPPTAKECLPSMCIPGDCVPKNCAEMFVLPLKPVFKCYNTLKKNQNQSEGYNTNKIKSEMISSMQNNIKNINSHFSFNIELNKKKKKNNIKRAKAIGRKRTDSKQYKTKRKASNALKRCFCTLKLKEKHLNQIRAYSKGSTSLIRNNKIKRKYNKNDFQCGEDHIKSTIRNYGLKNHKAASLQSGFCFLDNSGFCDSKLCNKKTKFRSRRSRVRHNHRTGQRLNIKTSKPSLITLLKSEHSSSETTSKLSHSNSTSKHNKNYQQELLNTEQPKSVVRIGSNFSFNIEFCKENMVPHTNKLHSKKIKHVTVKEPLLKRCFCALRLLKENIEKFNKNESTEKKEPKVLKKNQKSRCCQCDITYKKSIRFANCANKSSNTVMNNPISKSSGTSKSYFKSRMMQANISEPSPEKTDDITYNELINKQCMEDEKRVVRIGSSFSFNIEFYKQVCCADSNQDKDKTSKINNQRKVVEKDPLPVKTKEYAVQTIHPIRPNKKIQAHMNTTDKGMMTNSVLKSCFCTFKHNKFKTCKKRKFDCSKPVRPKEINKATMTKKYKKFKFNQTNCISKRNNERFPKYKHYKESGTGKVPEIIKLKSTSSAKKFAKSKTQRNQFDFNGFLTTKRIKVKNETCPISSARQAVCISSSFGLGIELNKEKQSKSPLFFKKNEEHANFKSPNSEKKNISDPIKYRQSIFNFMFKQCINFKKCKQSKERKVIETLITSVNHSDKFVFDNRLESTCHNRRLKAKSVINTVKYRAKRAEWNRGAGISYPNINSERVIQVENPKLKRRLHKKLYKNPVTIDLAFNNSKNNRTKPRINYKTEINNDFTAFNDTLITGKEIEEKYLQASKFYRHREYKVGYTLNEAIPAFYTTGFQEQQFNLCNIGLSYDDLKNIKIVNPVFVDNSPYTESHFVPNNVHKKNKLHKETVSIATSLQNTKLTKVQSVKNTSNTDNVNQNFSSCQCNIQKYNNQHPKQKHKLKEKMVYDNKLKIDSIQEIIENKIIYSNNLRFQRNENSPPLEKICNLPDCKIQKQENQMYCRKSRRL